MNEHGETVETLIIGAGLSGIYAACLLAEKNRPFLLLEARNRIGGRILCSEYNGYFPDLGPSWYWPDIHPKMARLVTTLNLSGYRQFENGYGRFQTFDGSVRTVRGYETQPPSWRIHGGMRAVVEKLGKKIPKTAIRTNQPVWMMEKRPAGIQVSTGEPEQPPKARFLAEKIILAMPPRLAASTIIFEPELSPRLEQAMLRIGTWMAGQAKFFAIYDHPFWRNDGLSGEAFSQRGPLGEIHDGSANTAGPYGLTGFVGIPAVQRNQLKNLEEEIVFQLTAIYGGSAAQPTAFFYQDWARERFTATDYDQPPMTEHPLYQPPAGKTAIWDESIHFAGTETADSHGGYLEGAIDAAERAVGNVTRI